MIGKILRKRAVPEVKYKYWTPVEDYFGMITGFKCECSYVSKRPLEYCMHCGSRMRMRTRFQTLKLCDSKYMSVNQYFNVYTEKGTIS